MLTKTKFVVKDASKMLSSMKTYEIADPDSSEVIGVAQQKAGWIATMLALVLGKEKMPMTIEVRTKDKDDLIFTVRRSGWIFPKVEVLDNGGQVVGNYKAKTFSLSGGYDVYDNNGTHLAEIQGKLLSSDFKFVSPDGSEMGSVSKSWGALAKELFTGAGTYGVQINAGYLDRTGGHNPNTIMLILGAAIAVDAVFKVSAKGAGTATASSTAEREE